MEPVDLKDLLFSVEKLMHEELMKHDIAMDINVNLPNTSLRLDRTLIEQVLINLITNSIHALEGRPKPIITLNASQEGQATIIEVHDNGKGITEKELNEIFIPFFSTKKEGSGIGLSLSKQIISLHGGNVKVKSKAGEGTSFYLNLKR
jgi:C4-dicarboxylate-specific signal transduction histidine kinase